VKDFISNLTFVSEKEYKKTDTYDLTFHKGHPLCSLRSINE
jgi:hypothetical protein